MQYPVGPEDEGLDPAELRFRLDSVAAGGWVTFIVCAAGFVYTAQWAPPDRRESMVLVLVVGMLGGAVSFALPWEQIVRSRYREAAFTAWSLTDLALILLLAGLDGGAASPLATFTFIPIVFAGMSYPRRSVVLIGTAVLAGYGAMAVASHTGGGYTLVFASALACTAVMSVWQARNHERRRELLSVASRTDPLTGALNRRGFQEAAATLMAAVARLDHPASLVLLDLDEFKQFNDTHGHAAGDELLRWVVLRIRDTLRPSDSVARMGGDEFAVLLSGADRSAAEGAIGRILGDLSSRVRCCSGMASAPADGNDVESLYRRADASLYETKRARVLAAAATTSP